MIIPAILKNNFEEVIEEIKLIDSVAELIQIDISDGTLIDDKTFTEIEKLDTVETDTKFELHLMVKNPEKYVEKKLERVSKVAAHIEGKNLEKFIEMAREKSYKVGLSINPGTPTEDLAPFIDKIDFVQFMAVKPGKQGGKFEKSVLDKISLFKEVTPNMPVQVDGGVSEANIIDLREMGVDNFVIGSQIFQAPEQSFQSFGKLIEERHERVQPQHWHNLKKIAFLGGADWQEESDPYQHAFETAKLLVKEGYEVVNGGGPGVMRASTLGAQKAKGRVLAVTYHPAYKHKNYEGIDPLNTFDEEIMTVDYFDRTKVMLQNSDVHIVFKGGTGTISEFGMTWANSRIHEGHHKPIILFGKFWEHIIREFSVHMKMRSGEMDLIKIVESPQECVDYIKSLGESSN